MQHKSSGNKGSLVVFSINSYENNVDGSVYWNHENIFVLHVKFKGSIKQVLIVI